MKVNHQLTFLEPLLRAVRRGETSTGCNRRRCPTGDAGCNLRHGDGNIKAQGMAINDTPTLSSTSSSDSRFGWTSIKFFMTPIDPDRRAAAVGLHGINISDVASGVAQLAFHG